MDIAKSIAKSLSERVVIAKVSLNLLRRILHISPLTSLYQYMVQKSLASVDTFSHPPWK